MLFTISTASGGNATENFRLSLGHRKTMGTFNWNVEYESVSGSFDYKKKAGKVDIVTSVRVSNAIQEGQLEGSSYFSCSSDDKNIHVSLSSNK